MQIFNKISKKEIEIFLIKKGFKKSTINVMFFRESLSKKAALLVLDQFKEKNVIWSDFYDISTPNTRVQDESRTTED